jgi:hypothetical protein
MTPSLQRARWAIEGLPTVDEVEKIYEFAAEHLRSRKALAGRSDADELETRRTFPAPPPESHR